MNMGMGGQGEVLNNAANMNAHVGIGAGAVVNGFPSGSGGSAGGADAAVHKVQDVEMGNRTSNPPANNTSASHFLDEEV